MKVTLNGKLYIVKWRHQRMPNDSRGTECVILNGDKETVSIAATTCSAKEQFKKDKGRKISLARAFKKLTFNKTERKVFWDEYLAR
jgi:hypothetical protein